MLSVQQVWTEQVQATPPPLKLPLSSFLVMHWSAWPEHVSAALILQPIMVQMKQADVTETKPSFEAALKKKTYFLFYFYSPIKLSAATRKGALACLLRMPAKSLKSHFTTSDVCVNLNKTVSKWATAPSLVSQEETGTAQVRASQDWLCLGHYLEEQPIKRPRYCATQQGARHARWKRHGLVPAYQAVNKTRWDTAVEPGAVFPFPHSPALQKQIRRERKSVQPVFPLPSPRCCTTPPLPPSLPLYL